MSFLYAVAFGGFVAFSTYLPTYLKDVYDFDLTERRHPDRRLRHRGGDRPPDRRHPVRQDRPRSRSSRSRSAGAAVLALVIALQPPPEVPAGALRRDGGLPRARHGRRLRLGGAKLAPADGSAASPGSSAQPAASAASSRRWSWARPTTRQTHSYTIGLVLLTITAGGALLFTLFGIRRKAPATS